MSLLLPSIAASALWAFTAQSYSWQQKLNVPVENDSQEVEDKEPYQGAWDHVVHWTTVDTRGRFKSVKVDRDVQGATIFLVNYGNGARVVQYHDPRILL